MTFYLKLLESPRGLYSLEDQSSQRRLGTTVASVRGLTITLCILFILALLVYFPPLNPSLLELCEAHRPPFPWKYISLSSATTALAAALVLAAMRVVSQAQTCFSSDSKTHTGTRTIPRFYEALPLNVALEASAGQLGTQHVQ